MKILALDPSTHCGWAHSCGLSGVFHLDIKRDESKGMRFLRLRAKLNEIYDREGVDVLVYEAARHAAPKMSGALVVQAEIQGVICLWCEDKGIEYRGVSPTEIKKHATGKGNASKDMMITAAVNRGWAVEDDNEADAKWLLDFAQNNLGLK